MTLPSRRYFVEQSIRNCGFSKGQLRFMNDYQFIPFLWLDTIMEQYRLLKADWAEVSYCK